MTECMGCICKPLVSCLSCFFCDCLWCECNCLIFPAPRRSYYPDLQSIRDGHVRVTIMNFNHPNKTIPYAQISTAKSRQSKKCFIYFHGNAQDITLVGMFLQPLVQELDITFYSIQYPNYSTYSACPAMISNTIKSDSLQFYDHLMKSGRNHEDIYVMGRSIGSGGAAYLAAHRNVPKLVLMSPFDSIRNVAMNLVGCMGCLVKQHFDNMEEIVKVTGNLLVIHGEVDEVIAVQRGRHLVKVYQQGNPYKSMATTVYPRKMSHNSFDIEQDIILPLKRFTSR